MWLQATTLVNNSDKVVQWALDLRSKDNAILEAGIFKFLHASGTPYLGSDGGVSGSLDPGQAVNLGVSFCPTQPGFYEVTVPVVINNNWTMPFTHLTVSGLLKAPCLSFDPLAIVLTPAPLDTSVTVEFRVLTSNYMRYRNTESTTNTQKKLGHFNLLEFLSYFRSSDLRVKVPEVECEDGSLIKPLFINILDKPSM